MDEQGARGRLERERRRVLEMLNGEVEESKRVHFDAAKEQGDSVDPAGPLTEVQIGVAVERQLRDRLAAIERAMKRLEDGTYGRSILSGKVIPDERLEADPAAELTVEEAAKHPRT